MYTVCVDAGTDSEQLVQIIGTHWYYSLSFSSVCMEYVLRYILKYKEGVGQGGRSECM